MYLDSSRLFYVHSYMVDDHYDSDYYVVDDFGNMVKLPYKMHFRLYQYMFNY